MQYLNDPDLEDALASDNEDPEEKEFPSYNMDFLDIKPVKTRASKHEVPPVMDAIGLKHPFSLSIIGNTGSGKTVLCLNLLMNENMYGGYFDKIHLFGLTVRSDDSWKNLNLPKDQIHDKPHQIVSDLRKILDKQRSEVEKLGVIKCKKVCLIFEDATANRKLLNSPEYIEAYVQNRHYAVTTVAMCHKYHAQTRVCRLNSNHIMIFPCTATEIQRLVSETQPSIMSKQEYGSYIAYCFEPSEDSQHPFLWLNFKAPESSRIRKTLKHIVNV